MSKHSEAKHTPGPWTIGNAHNCARDHAICDGPTVIARVVGSGYPIGLGWSPETAAHGRLIAAAPDLLAALERAEQWAMLTQTDPVSWLDDASTAVAKAKGEL